MSYRFDYENMPVLEEPKALEAQQIEPCSRMKDGKCCGDGVTCKVPNPNFCSKRITAIITSHCGTDLNSLVAKNDAIAAPEKADNHKTDSLGRALSLEAAISKGMFGSHVSYKWPVPFETALSVLGVPYSVGETEAKVIKKGQAMVQAGRLKATELFMLANVLSIIEIFPDDLYSDMSKALKTKERGNKNAREGLLKMRAAIDYLLAKGVIGNAKAQLEKMRRLTSCLTSQELEVADALRGCIKVT